LAHTGCQYEKSVKQEFEKKTRGKLFCKQSLMKLLSFSSFHIIWPQPENLASYKKPSLSVLLTNNILIISEGILLTSKIKVKS
jgi:hypothetical protein